MINNLVSLKELTKLTYNPALSGKYVKYLNGTRGIYRHHEIKGIAVLLSCLNLDEVWTNGFIYSYVVPRLSKEFDLLKISKTRCVNIELKSVNMSRAKITRQLVQNKHYLKLLGKKRLDLFCFVSCDKKFYKLDGETITECTASDVKRALIDLYADEIDLDEVFSLKNVLVSPLSSPSKFMDFDYILTEHQNLIKNNILSFLAKNGGGCFGVSGSAGTGKTLLVYDIARSLPKDKKIAIIHCASLCDGHKIIDEQFDNIDIIAFDDFSPRSVEFYDILIVDEAHRLSADKLCFFASECATCIFCFDDGRDLPFEPSVSAKVIFNLCGKRAYRLTNKMRYGKDVGLFINCLFDLSNFRRTYSFNNDVSVIFEPDMEQAEMLARSQKGYTFIPLDRVKEVIGQEFDGVCMILDSRFYYKNNTLKVADGKDRYLLSLYQGLARVRSKLMLIITDERLLEKVLGLL